MKSDRDSKLNAPRLSYPLIAVLNDITGVLLALISLAIFTFSDRERDLMLGLIGAVSSIVIGALLDRKRHFAFLEQSAIDIMHEISRKTIFEKPSADSFFSKVEILNQTMASSASTIRICGNTLGETIRTFGEVIAERYKAGATIEIVMLAKDEETLGGLVKRSWSNTISREDYASTIDTNSNFIKQLVNVQSPKGKLTIFYLDALPSCGIILVDAEKPTGTGQVKYYKFRKKGANIFPINMSTDPYKYREYIEEFESMRDASFKKETFPAATTDS